MRPEPALSADQDRLAALLLLRMPMVRGYLGIALLASACLHGLALYWHWQMRAAPAPVVAALEVMLVNTQTPDAPVNPTVAAQQALDGGGDAALGIAASPLPRTVVQSPDAQVLFALRKRQTALEIQQQALLTQLHNAQHEMRAALPQSALNSVGDADTVQEYQIVSARIAALKAQIVQGNAQSHRQVFGPAAVRASYAAYVQAWRQRIEALGTEHYPEQARGHTYGSLRLTVYIRRDGSLARMNIDRPSAHAVLNLAAQRIVQLAAPFAPLPDDIARDTEVLTITRTWYFTEVQDETRLCEDGAQGLAHAPPC